MSSSFTYSATIDAGQTQYWYTGGGNGWYQEGHFPQFDVRPQPSPGIFAGGRTYSVPLLYSDFKCSLSSTDPYPAIYFVTVHNDDDHTIPYEFRVWVP